MAELSETAAYLRILGDDLVPSQVTQLLGKEPTGAERKGDEVPLRNGRGTRTAHTGCWKINAEREMPGNLDAQIAKILEGTVDDFSIWLRLSQKYQVEFFCGLFLKEYNEGLCISAATTALLGARGIALDLDIYESIDD